VQVPKNTPILPENRPSATLFGAFFVLDIREQHPFFCETVWLTIYPPHLLAAASSSPQPALELAARAQAQFNSPFPTFTFSRGLLF
jgi:hypothetical protein